MAQRSLRDALLGAAAAEFHEKGYSATGVAAIAGRAGAPKGSFYNHFPSKDALGVLIVEQYAQTRGTEILLDPESEPLDALRKHFEYLRGDLAKDDYARGCLLGNFAAEVARSGTHVDTAVRDSLTGWLGAIAVPVRRLGEQGRLPGGAEPDEVARALGSAWEGAALLAKATGNAQPIEDFFAVTFPRTLGLAADAR
ncbi:MAG TPA: TetR family transcriptional regulator C-terminal domain-containing protein [Actinoplanes sp.]|jgi:TetR/AcrR family transcriptional repressor of nem operon